MLPYAVDYIKGSAVLLQVCQFSKPVIATDTGHLHDFVSEHSIGLLFEAGSSESPASCYEQVGELKHSDQLANCFDFAKPLNIF
jgi:hypothetical protein